jgi:enoyl-CoA hydratase/carnithine racemase
MNEMTSRHIREEAAQLLAPPERLGETVAAIADTLAANAPLSLRAMKLMVDEVIAQPGAPESEAARQAVAACLASADVEEGRVAFLERRKPRFAGS